MKVLALMIFCVCFWASQNIAAEEWQMIPVPGEPEAKPFNLPDLNGKLHSLSEYHNKFVLVSFWRNNCNICRSEMSSLHHHNKLMSDKGYQVVAIHAGPGQDEIRQLLERNPVDYTILIDADLELGDWSVPTLPTSYLVSPEGKLLYQAIGPRDWTSPAMQNFLEHVMAQDGAEKQPENIDFETGHQDIVSEPSQNPADQSL